MIALIMAAGRRPAGRLPLLLAAATLTAGCASGHSERQPASPPATGVTPAPIPFARGAYRYTFLATGARFSTNDPGPDDLPPPVSRERVYLVVDGQLANAGARPAPLDVGQPDVGVSIPLDILTRTIPHSPAPGLDDKCARATFFTDYQGASEAPGGRCVFAVYPTTFHKEATIPVGRSVNVSYYLRVPPGLPRDQLKLVGVQADRSNVTAIYPFPWKPL